MKKYLVVARKVLAALLGLVALILIIMWMSGVFSTRVPPERVTRAGERVAPASATAEVHQVTEHVIEEAVGTLRAERRTQVSSKILATIQEIRVRAGDKVAAGDVLVVLDSRDLASRLAQARQNVTSLEANLKNLKLAYEREKALFENQATSKSSLDQKEAAYHVAEAELERGRQAVREAEVATTHAVIRAPVAGVVVDRLAEPGDMAAPGRPLLSLYDATALRLEAPVRELLATTLKVGDSLSVRIDALDLTLPGTVDEIVPEAEAASRSFLVKVGIPRHEGLYSGMFGRLLIPAGERERVCMPLSALEEVGQLQFVNVIDRGRLDRRLVKIGEHSEHGFVEVLSGVSPGEVVLLTQ
ncbi:efflux RND transporter periplasmic adaptor subunit [bacterium]|nr:efflux RND transporter periplasmic adaptor subunit [bacterium]